MLGLALGKSLGEIRQMSPAELDTWREFYRLYPFDDHHRYHRPAALQAALVGGEYQSHLDFLSPPSFGDQFDEADLRTMRAFGLDPSMKE